MRHDHDDGSTFEDYVKVTFCLGTNLHQMCSPYFCEDQIKLFKFLWRSNKTPHISAEIKYISSYFCEGLVAALELDLPLKVGTDLGSNFFPSSTSRLSAAGQRREKLDFGFW